MADKWYDSDPDPVHGWFGLSYSSYQVLHRTLMQSMPVEWQRRMVACLEELSEAFDHVEQAERYIVEAATEVEEWDEEFDGFRHNLTPVPGGDPVPPYDRGRTRVEPRGDRG